LTLRDDHEQSAYRPLFKASVRSKQTHPEQTITGGCAKAFSLGAALHCEQLLQTKGAAEEIN
jgi:hypothetical protein